MKIDPNEPAFPIKKIGYNVTLGSIASCDEHADIDVNYPGLTIRAELAARFMAAMLSDRSNLDSFPKGFSIFDSKTKAEDKATKAIIDFMELMSKISILGADTLIEQLNKTTEDGK